MLTEYRRDYGTFADASLCSLTLTVHHHAPMARGWLWGPKIVRGEHE
jgi:hypothetical protein